MQDEPTAPGRQGQGRFWKEGAVAAAVVLLFFAAVDGGLDLFAEAKLAREVVDIQTPGMFEAKLHHLRKFQGYRVVLLGDSVVLGLSLREHGDTRWREHNLANVLQRRLEKAMPDRPVMVMNLAINGALPADLERAAERALAARPNLVVLDLGLRAFSADFAEPGAQLARPWLERKLPPRKRPSALGERLEAAAGRALTRHWRLYRLRDLGREAVLGGDLGQVAAGWHRGWQKALSGEEEIDEGDVDDLELLLKARSRFETVSVSADSPQRQALERLLARLSAASVNTLVFYARENPDVRNEIVEPARYEKLREELDAAIRASLGPTGRYVPGVPTLEPDNYLDFVHVDADGYDRMVVHMWPDVEALVRGRGRETVGSAEVPVVPVGRTP